MVSLRCPQDSQEGMMSRQLDLGQRMELRGVSIRFFKLAWMSIKYKQTGYPSDTLHQNDHAHKLFFNMFKRF